MLNGILFVKALLAGFVIAMPIGAVGALCMRQALHGQKATGVVTGVGAAVADAVLAAAAMFGLSLVTRHIIDNQGPLRLAGGLFLVCLGTHMIMRHRPVPASEAAEAAAVRQGLSDYVAALCAGFALTIVNPATFFAFFGVFAGLGLFSQRSGDAIDEWLILTGVFAGSMLWWLTLVGGSVALRRRLPERVITGVHVTLGIVVLVFGAATLASWLRIVL